VRALPTEVVPEGTQRPQSRPEFDLLRRHGLPKPTCALISHLPSRLRTPPTALRAVPPPRAGEGSITARFPSC
jgi:hypothetical protein